MRSGAMGGPIGNDDTKRDQFPVDDTLSYWLYYSPGPSPPPCIRIISPRSTYSCTPKMEAVRSFEMSVFIYKNTWRDIPEDSNLHTHRREKFSSRITEIYFTLRWAMYRPRKKVMKFNFSLMYNMNYDGSIIQIKSISSKNVRSRHTIVNLIKVCLEFHMWNKLIDKPMERIPINS
jgi:hypothetical protein